MTKPGKCRWINAAVAAAWAVGMTLAHAPCSSETIAVSFQNGVNVLAADSMEGRGLGTAGIDRAASWIERELKARGFRPLFEKSYRQQI